MTIIKKKAKKDIKKYNYLNILFEVLSSVTIAVIVGIIVGVGAIIVLGFL